MSAESGEIDISPDSADISRGPAAGARLTHKKAAPVVTDAALECGLRVGALAVVGAGLGARLALAALLAHGDPLSVQSSDV